MRTTKSQDGEFRGSGTVQPIHLGLSLTRSTGGQGESIRHFRKALGGTVVSFTPENVIHTEQSYIPGTLHIPVPRDPLSKLFMRPEARVLETLDSIVSEHNLIIVNLLYRYHVHWGFAVARRFHIPIWMVVHGGLDPYVFRYRKAQKKAWLSLWGRKFLSEADRVIFSTERERQKASGIYRGENTRVIPWPVEMRNLEDRISSGRRIRERYQIPDEKRVLLFLGRYEATKRPLETISCFANAGVSNCVLVFAGIEERFSVAELSEHAKECRISDRIRILGAVYGQDKEELLLGSDCFISLSWKENFGYTTAEALSAGTPVILSPGNDLRSLIEDSDCGWMLQDDEPRSAITAIQRFSGATDEELQEKGLAGHMRAAKSLQFSVFRHSLLAEI